MFKNMAKHVSWINMIVGEIGVLISAIILWSHSAVGYGFLVFFCGGLTVFAVSALLGILVEISENISNIDISNRRDYTTHLSKLSTTSNGGSANDVDFWICPQCKTRNDKLHSFCANCGKYK